MDATIKKALIASYKEASLEEKKLMCLDLYTIKKAVSLRKASSSSRQKKPKVFVA